MLSRYALTDEQWARIAELVPGKKTDSGRTAVDNRLFVDAVIYVAKTGIPWRDLPAGFGKWNSVWRRFDRWSQRNVWGQLAKAIDEPDLVELQVDSTSVKVHQVASGGRREGDEKKRTQIVVGALVAAGVG